MGGYWPAGDSRQRDCVHYCLPGVVDTWSSLLYNLLSSRRLRAAIDAAVDEPAANKQQTASRRRTSRFFAANVSEWLGKKGYAEALEQCTSGASGTARASKGTCETRLQQRQWWAFRCIENRERKSVRGPTWATDYMPWMPAESFD